MQRDLADGHDAPAFEDPSQFVRVRRVCKGALGAAQFPDHPDAGVEGFLAAVLAAAVLHDTADAAVEFLPADVVPVLRKRGIDPGFFSLYPGLGNLRAVNR